MISTDASDNGYFSFTAHWRRTRNRHPATSLKRAALSKRRVRRLYSAAMDERTRIRLTKYSTKAG
jgi:hypothetical protein